MRKSLDLQVFGCEYWMKNNNLMIALDLKSGNLQSLGSTDISANICVNPSCTCRDISLDRFKCWPAGGWLEVRGSTPLLDLVLADGCGHTKHSNYWVWKDIRQSWMKYWHSSPLLGTQVWNFLQKNTWRWKPRFCYLPAATQPVDWK